MKLIKPSFEIYEQEPGLEGIYEAIERAGRTCYKSTRPEGQTAKDFVDRMVASKHYAMLEHGTVYLAIPVDVIDSGFIGEEIDALLENPYVKFVLKPGFWYFSTNYRVIIENDLLRVLDYLCEPTEFHEKRVTVRFTTDRGVSHEFVRHRVFSFAQESTRYCNYSKDKFDNEVTFILPSWFESPIRRLNAKQFLFESEHAKSGESFFIDFLVRCEDTYIAMVSDDFTPQEARQVLPNALKTELVMTGFVSDWQHFFDLRARGTTGAPHPDAKALAEPLMEEFETRKLI